MGKKFNADYAASVMINADLIQHRFTQIFYERHRLFLLILKEMLLYRKFWIAYPGRFNRK
jgi:hypothetical protein